MKYFLHLAYNGAGFIGWQTQATGRTVQTTIKEAISILLNKETSIMGCGRTDAGVHASQYFIHFKSEKTLDELFVFKLNRLLPNDIKAFDLIEVKPDAHVQRDAISRSYTYLIHRNKNAFISEMSSHYLIDNFNSELALEGIRFLKTLRDFKVFCLQPERYKHTLCDIHEFKLSLDNNQSNIKIEISADRFLRAMIRLLVSSILDLSYGKISLDTLKQHVANEQRLDFFTKAYPQGLFLSGIKYPYLDCPSHIDPSTHFAIVQ